jgi:hypothetical protein
MGAIAAIRPVIEVDAVFAVAPTLSISHVPKRYALLPQWLPSKTAAVRRPPLTWTYSVELRGFEPLTPSMRTRCATGLRYSPKNESQRSKLCLLLAPPMSWALLADGADPTMAPADLLITATAEQHRLILLTDDKDAEVVATISGQPVRRVVDAPSAGTEPTWPTSKADDEGDEDS